jgi:hypothetical protein
MRLRPSRRRGKLLQLDDLHRELVRASGIEPLTPTMSRWVCMRRKSLISLKMTTFDGKAV